MKLQIKHTKVNTVIHSTIYGLGMIIFAVISSTSYASPPPDAKIPKRLLREHTIGCIIGPKKLDHRQLSYIKKLNQNPPLRFTDDENKLWMTINTSGVQVDPTSLIGLAPNVATVRFLESTDFRNYIESVAGQLWVQSRKIDQQSVVQCLTNMM